MPIYLVLDTEVYILHLKSLIALETLIEAFDMTYYISYISPVKCSNRNTDMRYLHIQSHFINFGVLIFPVLVFRVECCRKTEYVKV